jgi:NAD(P)-dependent dehydrogenase (short-subunit alcohol dehydrogenase family)
MKWTENDMPSLEGQVWVVTGANSGLGLETTRALAAKGATVVMGCRDPKRAEVAEAEVKKTVPAARLVRHALDLSSLQSIASFVTGLLASHPVLDGLINNAGVMAVPFKKTADGFELQFGTNHLGHFALSMKLLPLLEQARAPRLVTISSLMHKNGKLDFDDLMGERKYSQWGAYSNSKLANLVFTLELARKLAAAKKKTIAAAAHPGYAATGLQLASAKQNESKLTEWVMNLGNSVLAQTSAMGALPTLYAATAPDVKSGEYFGPDGFMAMKGHPARNEPIARAKDLSVAAELWARSEQLTGTSFPG